MYSDNAGNWIIESNDDISHTTIHLTGAQGSVIFDTVSNVRLTHVTVRADRPANRKDHLIVIRNSSNIHFQEVNLRCGTTDTENILDMQNSSHIVIHSASTTGNSRIGIALNQVTDCEFWRLDFDNCYTHVELRESMRNWFLGSAFRGPTSGYSIKVLSGSIQNGFILVRGRYNNACFMSEEENNVFHHCLCEREEGFGAGWGNNTTRKENGNLVSLIPYNRTSPSRWWTVFRPASFQNWTGGDFPTLIDAMESSTINDGDCFLVNAGPSSSEGNVVVTKQNLIIAENDKAQKGQYNYKVTVDSITMPRSTELRNIKVLGSVTYTD